MKTLTSLFILCALCCGMSAAAPAAAPATKQPAAGLQPSTNAASAQSATNLRPSTNALRRIVAIVDYNQTNGTVSARRAMTEMLLAAGLVPVVLPEMDDASADLVLSRCDAVLLGGSVPDNDYARRRAFEQRVLALAKKRGLIAFGICHGCQIINQFYGGDIVTVPKERVSVHKNVAPRQRSGTMAEHYATVKPGDSLMSRTLGEGRVMVNSSHKWRCGKLARGFRVTAVSEEDGIIEAIEHETLPIYGFQFHPEYYWRKDPRFLELVRNAFLPARSGGDR